MSKLATGINSFGEIIKTNKSALLSKIKSTGIYLLVPLINFGFSIFTSPVFAKYLSAEEFGYFGYYSTLSGFILVFYSLSFQTYYMSIYFRESPAERKATQASLVLFVLLWNVVFFPVSYGFLYLYFKYSQSIIPFFPFALLTLGGTVLGVSKGFVQINFRLEQKPIRFLIWVSGFRVLTIVISLYFVIVPKLGLMGRMAGIFIVEVIFLVISLYLTFKNQRINIDRNVIKKSIRKILPLLPASLLFIPIFSYDNIALERMHQPKEMGLYNIGKNIAQYLYTALYPFFQAFEPDIYKNAIARNTRGLVRIGLLIGGITVCSLVCFWIFSPYLISYLTAGKYTEALRFSNILAVTYCLIIFYSVFDAIVMAWQETKAHLVINAIVSTCSIIMFTLGAHFFSQMGVAFASSLNWTLMILIQIFFVWKKIKNYKTLQSVSSSSIKKMVHE